MGESSINYLQGIPFALQADLLGIADLDQHKSMSTSCMWSLWSSFECCACFGAASWGITTLDHNTPVEHEMGERSCPDHHNTVKHI